MEDKSLESLKCTLNDGKKVQGVVLLFNFKYESVGTVSNHSLLEK
jgi:hypothetical protein